MKRLRIWGLALLGAAPACYTGSARDVSSQWVEKARADASWQIVGNVPFVAQKSDSDCGPAALSMVLAHFGVSASLDQLTALKPPSEGGVRAGALRDVARDKGLEAFVVSGSLNDLVTQIERGRPVLVGLAKPMVGSRALAHYEVVVGINRPKKLILSLDPSRGPRQNTLEGFAREWVPTHQVTIVIFKEAAAGVAGSRSSGTPPHTSERDRYSVIALTSDGTPTALSGAMSNTTAREPDGRSRRAASIVARRGSRPGGTSKSMEVTPQTMCSRRVVSGTRL